MRRPRIYERNALRYTKLRGLKIHDTSEKFSLQRSSDGPEYKHSLFASRKVMYCLLFLVVLSNRKRARDPRYLPDTRGSKNSRIAAVDKKAAHFRDRCGAGGSQEEEGGRGTRKN